MDREGFVKLALLAFGLVIVSFFVRGFGQLLLGREVAELLQAPLLLGGFLLVVYLFVRATASVLGVVSIDE